MTRITIGDVRTTFGLTNSYDIMNAIRNEASAQFQQYVPLANADNIAEVGAGLSALQTVQNEFISTLVDRIGLTVIKSVSLNNPLKKFKKGVLPHGRTIQEVFVDITHEHLYDPEQAEETVFKREIPDVHTLYHELNRQGFYKQTIQDESLQSAFISWSNFDSFIVRILNSIYNSAEVGEYYYMRMLLDNYASKGLYNFVRVADPMANGTNMSNLVKQIRTVAQQMTLPMGTRKFNSAGVHTRTEMDRLHLIITPELQATMDVDVMAKAFNMDRTSFLGRVTVIDEFATPGMHAVLIDEDFFMVYDRIQKMETIRNTEGLYWNYTYHVWQILSASRFSNAVAFIDEGATDIPPITQVIVSPIIENVKAGKTKQFTAQVRTSVDDADTSVVWSVEGKDGTAVATGTSITQDGILTVASDQTGRLTIKATASYAGDPDPVNVVGEAIVSVG